jgi:hypothetical protein
MTTRASMVTSSMPTSETLTYASMTSPLSRIVSMTSARPEGDGSPPPACIVTSSYSFLVTRRVCEPRAADAPHLGRSRWIAADGSRARGRARTNGHPRSCGPAAGDPGGRWGRSPRRPHQPRRTRLPRPRAARPRGPRRLATAFGLSGLARKFIEGAVHAARARGWALLRASRRCSRLSRSVRVNFQLNGLAMAL